MLLVAYQAYLQPQFEQLHRFYQIYVRLQHHVNVGDLRRVMLEIYVLYAKAGHKPEYL